MSFEISRKGFEDFLVVLIASWNPRFQVLLLGQTSGNQLREQRGHEAFLNHHEGAMRYHFANNLAIEEDYAFWGRLFPTETGKVRLLRGRRIASSRDSHFPDCTPLIVITDAASSRWLFDILYLWSLLLLQYSGAMGSINETGTKKCGSDDIPLRVSRQSFLLRCCERVGSELSKKNLVMSSNN